MGKGEGPETEIARCVADGAEDEFYCLDQLVDHQNGEPIFMLALSLVLAGLAQHFDQSNRLLRVLE